MYSYSANTNKKVYRKKHQYDENKLGGEEQGQGNTEATRKRIWRFDGSSTCKLDEHTRGDSTKQCKKTKYLKKSSEKNRYRTVHVVLNCPNEPYIPAEHKVPWSQKEKEREQRKTNSQIIKSRNWQEKTNKIY